MTTDQKMKYEYTIFIKDEKERIKTITDDILIEYPRLGVMAEKIAKMERPFGPSYDTFTAFSVQENCINRLIDIIIVTEGKDIFKEEYTKACEDLERNFQSWLHLFSNDIYKKQPVYLVMQSFYAHQSNNNFPIMTFSQAIEEIKRRNEEENITKSANGLRELIPELAEFAEQVAYIESTYDRLDMSLKDISNLVIAFNLLEEDPKNQQLCQEIVNVLKEKYISWLNTYGNNPNYSNKRRILSVMMERLNRHLKGENIEVLSYYDIAHSIESNNLVLRRHQD